MSNFTENPYLNKIFPTDNATDNSKASIDVAAVNRLLNLCPIAQKTPLHASKALAEKLNIGNIWFKDERMRMGLGSFKALGASYVIASEAAEKLKGTPLADITETQWKTALTSEVFVAASAGNHGLSVAAGARIFGAKAVIYLSKTVPEDFANRLRGFGAEVVIAGDDYDESLAESMRVAEENGWYLLADGTWEGYDTGRKVMEGYLVMADEAYSEMVKNPPTHIFLQAGVGGLAAAAAIMAREYFADTQIIVVEPDKAPCLQQSILAGKLIEVTGGDSNMGRLDCKTPSLVALNTLAYTANHFMLVSDEEAEQALPLLKAHDFATSPSGGAGFIGLQKAIAHQKYQLDETSNVLIFLSEQEIL